jgi:c-di-GMP-binding flagellar brake protein YcgR
LHQGPEIPEHDRRQHTRVAFNKAVTVDAAAPSGPLTGYTRDLSKGGMSIIARAPVPLSVALIVLPREGANPLRVRSHVVRCNRIQEGFYDIGVQFLRLEKNAGM